MFMTCALPYVVGFDFWQNKVEVVPVQFHACKHNNDISFKMKHINILATQKTLFCNTISVCCIYCPRNHL